MDCFLDADEFILPKDSQKIVRIINEIEKRDPTTDGFVLQHISIDEASGSVMEINRLIRVFRKSTLRYQGAIHESVYKLNGNLNIADGTASDIAIYHTGYSVDRIELKAERNLKLLLKDMENGNENEMTPLYLSDCYMALGEFEKSLEYAVKFIRRNHVVYGFNAKPYSTVIRSLMVLNKDNDTRRTWIEKAITKFPGHPDFMWYKGIQHLAEAEYSAGLEALLQAIECNKNYVGSESKKIAYALGEIYVHIASVYKLKNDYLNALEYYLKALKENKQVNNAFEGLVEVTQDYSNDEFMNVIRDIYDDSESDIGF